MHERFTGRARRIMHFANEEAFRFNSESIATEHLLLGLVDLGAGVAATVLAKFRVGGTNIRHDIEQIIRPEPGTVMTITRPLGPSAKKVIDIARREARKLNHEHIGTEHILLGLLGHQESVAAQVLMSLGLSFDEVRAEIVSIHGEASAKEIRSATSNASRDTTTGATPPTNRHLAIARESCPKCGVLMMPVLSGWRTSWLSAPELSATEAGGLILGPGDRRLIPAQVCLACVPLWHDVHNLARRDYDLQLAKMAAVDQAKFERAASLLDQQAALRPRMEALLNRLLRSELPG